jgi:adenylosuccinate lyase
MPTRKPVIVSVLLTIILLVLVAILTMFVQIVLLNGVMNEGQATTALGVTLGCQAVTILLGAILARWSTRLLISRFQLGQILAVLIPVVIMTILGAVTAILSIFTGLIAAGIN